MAEPGYVSDKELEKFQNRQVEKDKREEFYRKKRRHSKKSSLKFLSKKKSSKKRKKHRQHLAADSDSDFSADEENDNMISRALKKADEKIQKKSKKEKKASKKQVIIDRDDDEEKRNKLLEGGGSFQIKEVEEEGEEEIKDPALAPKESLPKKVFSRVISSPLTRKQSLLDLTAEKTLKHEYRKVLIYSFLNTVFTGISFVVFSALLYMYLWYLQLDWLKLPYIFGNETDTDKLFHYFYWSIALLQVIILVFDILIAGVGWDLTKAFSDDLGTATKSPTFCGDIERRECCSWNQFFHEIRIIYLPHFLFLVFFIISIVFTLIYLSDYGYTDGVYVKDQLLQQNAALYYVGFFFEAFVFIYNFYCFVLSVVVLSCVHQFEPIEKNKRKGVSKAIFDVCWYIKSDYFRLIMTCLLEQYIKKVDEEEDEFWCCTDCAQF